MRLTLPQLPAEWGKVAFYAMAAACVAPGLVLTVQEVWAGQPFWGDEAFSAGLLHIESLGQALSMMRNDAHPPLYYLLLMAWAKVFGTGEVAVRSLSLVAVLATVGILWWQGPKVLSRPALAIASVWIFSHWLFLILAYQVRMYALVLMGATWLSLAFARLWTASAEPSRREMAMFCLGAALLAMLHYTSMALACSALLLLLLRHRRLLWLWPMAAAVALLCSLWLVPNVLHRVHGLDSHEFVMDLPGVAAVGYWLVRLVGAGLLAVPAGDSRGRVAAASGVRGRAGACWGLRPFASCTEGGKAQAPGPLGWNGTWGRKRGCC